MRRMVAISDLSMKVTFFSAPYCMGWLSLYLKKFKDKSALTKFNPEKVSSESIASLENLCLVLDITRVDLDSALHLSGVDRYKEKSTPKKDGTLRMIYNPHYLIRKIQRRINKRIFSNPNVIRWPDHIFGSIPNQIGDNNDPILKDYISCARLHCCSKSILTIDIKDFFNNIHQNYVEEIFLTFLNYNIEVARALADMCCLNSHLVQGALTSSYIASLCLWDVEGDVVKKLQYKNLVYTRLVDDINVSSKVSDYDFSYAMRVIEEMATEKGLQLNHKKTNIQYISTKPLTVHGLRVAFKEPRLPSDEVRKIRSAVKNIETLASECNYRTSHAYRKDFNRCMGRVNKLDRVGHKQHSILLARLRRIFPLPSKKDIARVTKIIDRLEVDNNAKRDTYWYWRRYYLAHERLNVLQRTFPSIAKELRERMKLLKPKYV